MSCYSEFYLYTVVHAFDFTALDYLHIIKVFASYDIP